MAIKKIKVSNFQSFKNLEVELGKFNVLIGTNASGKSNFVEIFRFLRDIVNEGLDNAISMQGGVEYLRNMNIGSSENFSLEVVFESSEGDQEIQVEAIYRFTIRFGEGRSEFEIIEDKLTIQVYTKIKQWRGEITISNNKGKIESNYKLPNDLENILQKEQLNYSFIPKFTKVEEDILQGNIEVKSELSDILQKSSILLLFTSLLLWQLQFLKIELHTLLIKLLIKTFNFLSSSISREVSNIFLPDLSDISIYEFDPKLPKQATTPMSGMVELEEDGNNLAIVLKNILEDNEKKREFTKLIIFYLL